MVILKHLTEKSKKKSFEFGCLEKLKKKTDHALVLIYSHIYSTEWIRGLYSRGLRLFLITDEHWGRASE